MSIVNQPDENIKLIKGVGSVLANKLNGAGITTVLSLLEYFPRRYEDYSNISKIIDLKPGTVTIKAYIKDIKGRYVRRGFHITEAVASDDSSSVRLIWFNQPYREKGFTPGCLYYISGQFGLQRGRLLILNPSVERDVDFPVNTARILAVYREAKGLKSRQIRKLISECRPMIADMDETLPDWVVRDYKLMSRAQAVEAIHFPESLENLSNAKRRIGFEEVFNLVLACLSAKYEIKSEQTLTVKFNVQLAKEFVKNLPFKLTDDQRLAVMSIYKDLEHHQPMNRLIEGDVGSGKTVVAAMGSLMAIAEGYQVVMMAPTEILARQHANTVYNLLSPMHTENTVALLVGSLTKVEKNRAIKSIASGRAKFIIGTHALIQERVDMHNLALIIIDEQHRFGVNQRQTLIKKAGHMPHVLSLSATPIPRSLALTVFRELSISRLKTNPSGRKNVITKIVMPGIRTRIYEFIDEQIEKGRQVFIVTPLVNESFVSNAVSAEEVFDKLKTGPFKKRRIGLLHGKQKPALKNEIMNEFVMGKLDILVSTTVIEVGVDVPNATIMIIENAERFGLAQLHQLRGRVGRGKYQGYCYLMVGSSQASTSRLRALESSSDGFELAELDLKLRGPGAIYGTIQHGALDLKIAQLNDKTLIAEASEAADMFMAKDNLLKYPRLSEAVAELKMVTNLN